MGLIAIHSVRLFDGIGIKEKATVVFDSLTGKIVTVTSDGEGDGDGVIPDNATCIDGQDHTLIPGLIDSHVHSHTLHAPESSITYFLEPALKCGITTLCDMHSDPPTVEKQRALISDEIKMARVTEGGIVTLPDLKSALYAATIEGGWPKPIVLHGHPTDEIKQEVSRWPSVTSETAKSYVRSNKRLGADYIKLMQENCCSLALPTDSIPSATLELQTAVVDAAHDEGLIAAGHALDLQNTEILLKSGVDGLTHTFVDQAPTDDIVSLYKSKQAFLIPTLVVLSSLVGEEQELRESFAQLAADKGLIDQNVRELMVDTLGLKAAETRVEYAYQTVRRLHQEGIDIVAGTDSVGGLKGTAIGPSMWMELQMYVDKCGFTPTEALRTATSVAATRFRFSDRGIIEAGRRADLVLLKNDPCRRIDALWASQGIVAVWKEGLQAYTQAA